jgi:SNF2 family DNA or RNA helicase
MTERNPTPEKELERLMDAIAESIPGLSDQEILEEVSAAGENDESVANHVRSVLRQVLDRPQHQSTSPVSLFTAGQQVRRQSARDQLGVVIGAPKRIGGEWWYSIFLGGARPMNLPESDLEAYTADRSLEDLLVEGIFGNKESFSKLITLTKLQFPLRNNIYAFRASRTEFKAYQFRPLLKFLESPKQRLLIADEVGLGKTIEAGLILSELRARHPSTLERVLVVCPSALCGKWQTELRARFDEKFNILDSRGVRNFLDEFEREGEGAKLKAICSIQTMRGRDLMEQWEAVSPTLDMLVVDEAHHLRNPETFSHRMGRTVAESADAVLLLTATPIHLGNVNLFYLLRILDPEQFGSDPSLVQDELGESIFSQMMTENAPLVEAVRLLRAKFPPDLHRCKELLRRVEKGVLKQRFLANPEYKDALAALEESDPTDRTQVVQLQRKLTSLNVLSSIFTRTRKREVETRTIREAKAWPVKWTDEERAIYDTVTSSVVSSLRGGISGSLSMFLLMMPQRQVASCIPAAAARYSKDARIYLGGRDEELSDFDLEDFSDETDVTQTLSVDLRESIQRWDAAGRPDAKFQALCSILQHIDQIEPNAKLLVFAYFKPTLEYLSVALSSSGYRNAVISGDYDTVTREERMNAFRKDPHMRILLSSEVGSEGLDFEFCHILVNYDLPWNPMVVEQRIGRLDRIGQKAHKISIFNLSIPGTIEDRILTRLYARIRIFEQSIGDLEPIIGEEIQKLTRDLFNRDLSASQQEARIQQSAEALENRRQDIENLEANSSRFIGADEFFNDEIGRIERKKRFISPSELQVFLSEFLARHFPDCRLEPVGAGYWRLKVSAALAQFVRSNVSNDDPSWFEFFRRTAAGQLRFTFDSDVALIDRDVDFVNVHHPLVHAIALHYQDHTDELHPVARIQVNENGHGRGDFIYSIYRLEINGAQHEHFLKPVFVSLDRKSVLDEESAEDLLSRVVTEGTTIDLAPPYQPEMLATALHKAEDVFGAYLDEQRRQAARINEARVEVRLASLKQSYEARIAKKEEQLRIAHSKGSSAQYIRLLEGTIRRLRSDYQKRVGELEEERKLELTFDRVAAGFLRVNGASS